MAEDTYPLLVPPQYEKIKI